MPELNNNAGDALGIKVMVGNSRVEAVEVRPPDTIASAHRLEGRPIGEAISLLPALSGPSNFAQGIAGLVAIEHALGITPSPAVVAARRLLVAGETVGHILWELLLDAPTAMGRDPDIETLRAARAAIARIPRLLYAKSAWLTIGGADLQVNRKGLAGLANRLEKLIAKEVLGSRETDSGILQNAENFFFWTAEAETVVARVFRSLSARRLASFGNTASLPLPNLDPEEIFLYSADNADSDLVSRIATKGIALETGPLARQWEAPLVTQLREEYGSGLVTRFAAALLDLVSGISEFRNNLEALDGEEGEPVNETDGSGTGVSCLETARGRLCHQVCIDHGRITRYRILAPPHWNFHPEGIFARGLVGARYIDSEYLHQVVSLLVMAIDPLITFTLDIVEN